MPSNPDRREFLRRAAPAFGFGLVALAGCSKPGSTPATGADPVWAPHIAGLQTTIPGLMEKHKIPGLSIALIRNARIEWSSGFGVPERASTARVDGASMFEAGSMSKPVFAYSVMKLRERGVLDLDTPLTRYSSDRFLNGDPRLELITARHVLSHTSGFQNNRSGADPLKIQFTPGEKWQYSGEGYAYLQSVVTALTGKVDPNDCSTFEAELRVCGTDFDEQMTTNLLGPLGMHSSGYVSKERFAGHLVRGHDEQGNALAPGKYTAPGAARYGAMGALLTTATDYAKFLIEVMDPQPADAFRLNHSSLEEMLRPHVKVEDGPGYAISWALGWKFAQTRDFGGLVSHGGDQAGFHSTAEFSPLRRSGYVMLTNGDNGWKLIQELAPEVARWIYQS